MARRPAGRVRRVLLLQAVHAHARFGRGRDPPARRPADHAAPRRAATRPWRADRRHRAGDVVLLRGDRHPDVRPARRPGDGRGLVGARGQRAHRRPPPVSGAGRSAHPARALRKLGRAPGRLRGRREQRRTLAHGGRGSRRLRALARLPVRVPARRRHHARSRSSGARGHRPARSGRRRPGRVHRRLGLDGGRDGARSPAQRAGRLPRRPRPHGPRGPRRGVPALLAGAPRRGGRRRGDRRPPQRRVAAGRQPPADRAGASCTPSRTDGRAERCASSSPLEATPCCGGENPPMRRHSATTSRSPSGRSPSSRSRTSSW